MGLKNRVQGLVSSARVQCKKALGHRMAPYRLRFEYAYAPRVRPYERSVGGRQLLARIEEDREEMLGTMRGLLDLRERFTAIPALEQTPGGPRWINNWLPAFDGMLIYGLIHSRKPRYYLEVGSGESTRFARRAIEDAGLDTRIISIDPQPRNEVDRLCDRVVRAPVEDADLDELVSMLGANDIVFIDNSHRSFQNSDVTVCFTELLPALPSGCCYGVHDICLPYDYESCFLGDFYSEQYLLAMYLLGGAAGDRILMPSYFAARDPELAPLQAESMNLPVIPLDRRGGSSFWMRRA